ncbi:hypothetical protein HK104_007271, partial [Borealophlyctis nickersoniae]
MEELKRIEDFQSNVTAHLNIPSSNNTTPMTPRKVEVVNIGDLASAVQRHPNPGTGAEPLPDPQPRPPPPRSHPPRRGDDYAMLHPVTKELSTTSTQTMREMVDSGTSPSVHTTSVGSTQTEPDERDMMQVDVTSPPLNQIVNNYYLNQNYHNYHNQAIHNTENVLNQQYFIQHNLNQMFDARTANHVVNQNLYHQNVLNMMVNQQPPQVENNLTPQVGHFQRHAIEAPGQLLLEGPVHGGALELRNQGNAVATLNPMEVTSPTSPVVGPPLLHLLPQVGSKRKRDDIVPKTKRVKRKISQDSSVTVED